MPEKIKVGNVPTIFVIFGGTGDLARKKLLPALFDLYSRGLLPDQWRLIGFSRREFSDAEYREFVERESIIGRVADKDKVRGFIEHIHYLPGDFNAADAYGALALAVIAFEKQIKMCTNKLLYLAASPGHYEDIIGQIANSGLSLSCSDKTGWTRILIEKPFGKDIKTAKELDQMLGLLFKEEQIFRIDHYLGKNAVQDILVFRFANRLFEPLWDKEHIRKVEITMNDTSDLSLRGDFYDGVGELRDVGQNHILQMLALVAMDRPDGMSADSIRTKRTEVFEALAPLDVTLDAFRAQYSEYVSGKGVNPHSQTETYFKLRAFLNMPRWDGVPFYLESGKALAERKTEIRVTFKHSDTCLCSHDDEIEHENVLVFRIQPDEGISVRFWARKAGFDHDLAARLLSFTYNGDAGALPIPDAYEKVLYDSIIGDQTLFASTAEVERAWAFITPIIDSWGVLPLVKYKKGEQLEVE